MSKEIDGPLAKLHSSRINSLWRSRPRSRSISRRAPNNPLGSTWIALSKASYGIHGTPEPAEVGRAASHGCVRLTNWDARRLASMISRGVPINFRSRT
jgi:lipoprotein-anchoring transpeptidase ErfK/SrfK